MSVISTGKPNKSVCCNEPCAVCQMMADAPDDADQLWNTAAPGVAINARRAAILSFESGWFVGFMVGMIGGRHGRIENLHLCDEHAETLSGLLKETGATMKVQSVTHPHPVTKH